MAEWRTVADRVRLALWHRSWNAPSRNTSEPTQSRPRDLNGESFADAHADLELVHSPETKAPVQFGDLSGKRRLAAEVLALAYIAIVAEVAIASGAFYILFPELAALSHDIFTRPRGSWASAPVLLVITPVLTAVLGTLVTRTLPYDYLSVMLAVCGALAIVLALRSPIAPAISAGLLPLALGARSLWYPPGIVFGTVLLAVFSSIWKRLSDEPLQNTIVASEDEDTAPGAESNWRLLPLLVLVLAAVFVVKLTNLRFVLFPPLVVIGFEMFLHTKRCPWATRTLSLPTSVYWRRRVGCSFVATWESVLRARSSAWRGES